MMKREQGECFLGDIKLFLISTVRTCMEKIVGGTDTIARIHQRLSAKIREEIETPFNEFRESQRKLKKTVKKDFS